MDTTVARAPETPRELKANKHRIVLRDGREVQYHRPGHYDGATEVQRDLREALPADFPAARQLLEVEIGPGKGEFLAARASQHPDRFFVGIDRRADRHALTQRKLERAAEGKNWVVLREDARAFLKAPLPPLAVLHVYHPDPWPKARHHKHRFFRSPDARRWAEALREGGELRISTDHRGYFEEILDVVDSWQLFAPALVFVKHANWGPTLSHFEEIFRRKGEPVFKARFRRLSAS